MRRLCHCRCRPKTLTLLFIYKWILFILEHNNILDNNIWLMKNLEQERQIIVFYLIFAIIGNNLVNILDLVNRTL